MDTKKTHLSHISNWIFLGITIFSLFFLWCSYYSKNINLSLFTGIISALCFYVISIPIYHAITKRRNVNTTKKVNFENFKTNIICCKFEKTLEILKPILNFNHFKRVSCDHYIIDAQKDLIFIFDDISTAKLSQIYRNRITDKIIIVCANKVSPEITLSNVEISFLEISDIYKFYDCTLLSNLDTINIQKKPKYSLKDILCIVFCKSKSKTYFWLALILLFSSLFTPFSTYYIVSSTILFLISIFSRFNPFFNK